MIAALASYHIIATTNLSVYPDYSNTLYTATDGTKAELKGRAVQMCQRSRDSYYSIPGGKKGDKIWSRSISKSLDAWQRLFLPMTPEEEQREAVRVNACRLCSEASALGP